MPAVTRYTATIAALLATSALGAQPAAEPPMRQAGCEGCGAAEAPARLTAEATLVPRGEPGAPLVVTGVVYRPDGRTPAPGVLVYAYQTNAAGVYPPRAGATGNSARHGRLRGWLRTDARGHYRLVTIRPGLYPGRVDPAHIHLTVTPPGGAERWIDEIQFEDDPRMTAALRARQRNVGGRGIVRATRDRTDTLRATRDIVLETWP